MRNIKKINVTLFDGLKGSAGVGTGGEVNTKTRCGALYRVHVPEISRICERVTHRQTGV